MANPELQCGFCYPREQGTHGEIKREWSRSWRAMIPLCRKHSERMQREEQTDGLTFDGEPSYEDHRR